MIICDLYDKQDLDNKIIIWKGRNNNKYQCFKIVSQRIGANGMSICACDLYIPYIASIFWKQDMDIINLFIVKQLYRSI